MIESSPLRVLDLSVSFPLPRQSLLGRRSVFHAVRSVSFAVGHAETLAIVGESGSGKSTTARAILRLVEPESGQVLVDGVDWLQLSGRRLRAERRKVQMVFQDPYSSLDPSMTVGHALSQPLLVERKLPLSELREQVSELLRRVGLDPQHASRYPHEFSGGQRQRIAIARALASNPRVLVCDEAVSALDVSTQNHILNLLMDLQRESGISILFIAHDLSVVRHASDRVAVMYRGNIVELGDVKAVFDHPAHPYTKALLEAAPVPDPRLRRPRSRSLVAGEVGSADGSAHGCPYMSRCPDRMPECSDVAPQPVELESGVMVSCHLHRRAAPARAAGEQTERV